MDALVINGQLQGLANVGVYSPAGQKRHVVFKHFSYVVADCHNHVRINGFAVSEARSPVLLCVSAGTELAVRSGNCNCNYTTESRRPVRCYTSCVQLRSVGT